MFSSEHVYSIACVRACVRFATSEPITLGAADAFYIILIYRLAAIQIDLDRISLYAQNKWIAKRRWMDGQMDNLWLVQRTDQKMVRWIDRWNNEWADPLLELWLTIITCILEGLLLLISFQILEL